MTRVGGRVVAAVRAGGEGTRTIDVEGDGVSRLDALGWRVVERGKRHDVTGDVIGSLVGSPLVGVAGTGIAR